MTPEDAFKILLEEWNDTHADYTRELKENTTQIRNKLHSVRENYAALLKKYDLLLEKTLGDK